MTPHPIAAHPPLRAPRGTALSCHGWAQEAALRLLLNSLDPEVADRPDELLICEGQAAVRDCDALTAIRSALPDLENDQVLLIRSGAVARVAPSSVNAPRLVSVATRSAALALLDLREVLRRSAASWSYVGSQVILQATDQNLAAAAVRFGGSLAGKLLLAVGLGPFNSALSLSAAVHGAATLVIEPSSDRAKRAVKAGYADVMVNHIDEALRILKNNVRLREPVSVALLGDAGALLPEMASRGIVPDLILGDRDSPRGDAISQLERMGAALFDAATLPPGAHEPLTVVALSGEPADIAQLDRLLLERFASDQGLQRLLATFARRIRPQGLPARVVWLDPGQRVEFARAANDLVAQNQLRAPLVLARVVAEPVAVPLDGASGDPLLPLPAPIRQASWAALESFDGDPAIARAVSLASVADGSAEAQNRIESTFGAIS